MKISKKRSNQMRLIGILFGLSFLFFPSVRYNTGAAIHTAADFIQSTAK